MEKGEQLYLLYHYVRNLSAPFCKLLSLFVPLTHSILSKSNILQIQHLDVTHLRLFRSEQNKHSDRKCKLSPKVCTFQAPCNGGTLLTASAREDRKGTRDEMSLGLPIFPCGRNHC